MGAFRGTYLCSYKKKYYMLHSRKNDLLIGFIVSALLSLFVNFSMLIRKYDVININKHSAFPAPPEFLNDYFFYFHFCGSFCLLSSFSL